jgi:hypothetical protein
MKASQFFNPQEAEEKMTARYRVMLILWAAILASLGFFLMLALLTPSSGTPNQTLTFTLLGIGLVMVIFSLFIKNILARQAIEKQQAALLQNAYVIAFAMSESAGLFALVDHFMTGSPYYYVGFGAAAIGMLLNFPNKDYVRATM